MPPKYFKALNNPATLTTLTQRDLRFGVPASAGPASNTPHNILAKTPPLTILALHESVQELKTE